MILRVSRTNTKLLCIYGPLVTTCHEWLVSWAHCRARVSRSSAVKYRRLPSLICGAGNRPALISQCIFLTGTPSCRAASDTLNSLSTVLRSGAVTFIFPPSKCPTYSSVADAFFVAVVTEKKMCREICTKRRERWGGSLPSKRQNDPAGRSSLATYQTCRADC